MNMRFKLGVFGVSCNSKQVKLRLGKTSKSTRTARVCIHALSFNGISSSTRQTSIKMAVLASESPIAHPAVAVVAVSRAQCNELILNSRSLVGSLVGKRRVRFVQKAMRNRYLRKKGFPLSAGGLAVDRLSPRDVKLAPNLSDGFPDRTRVLFP
jgi:hypothetical protein